jgi:hypothetical protein
VRPEYSNQEIKQILCYLLFTEMCGVRVPGSLLSDFLILLSSFCPKMAGESTAQTLSGSKQV